METGRPAVSFLNNGLFWKITVIVLLWLFYKLLKSKWLYDVLLAFSLPGPPAIPIIGNAHLLANNKEMLEMSFKNYGPLFRWWLGLMPWFVIVEPDEIKKVLSSQKHVDKPFVYSLMHNFLGEGLITSSGNKWRFNRKLLQSSFQNAILEDHITVFTKHATNLINQLTNSIEINQNLDITTFINETVVGVLHETVLGLKLEDESKKSYIEESPFRQGTVTTVSRLAKPWLLFNSLYNLTTSSSIEIEQNNKLKLFTKKLINEKKHGTLPISGYKSLLERMLEISQMNPSFDENEIIGEVCTFMLAGQDSVAASLAFSLYFLAKHPEIQNRVYKEQKQIFGESERTANIEDVYQMSYLNQCIKEALRLCPSVPLIARKLQEDTRIGNIVLTAGTNVALTPFFTHRLSHIYPDPSKYDPDRFSVEESTKRSPYAFYPFSAGPRNCLGYKFALIEMRTIISTILRKYNISVTDGYDLQLMFRITLRAKGGIWLKFEPRN